MATPGGRSLVDSDDDLAGFLAGLRKRYNLDTSPLPAGTPQSRLAISTEANIFGSNIIAAQPAFPNPNSIASSPSTASRGSAANAGEPAASATTGSKSKLSASQGEPLSPRSPTSSSVEVPAQEAQEAAAGRQDEKHAAQLHSPAENMVHLQQQQQHNPEAESESGSCDSPHTLLLLQNLQQTASQLATAAGAVGSSTPTDVHTVAGGAVGAVAGRYSPRTTAAMPHARMSAWQNTATPAENAAVGPDSTRATTAEAAAAGDAADAADAAAASEVLPPLLNLDLQQATMAPSPLSATASLQMAAAAEASSSTDFDSPSVKKPLYGAFMAAAAAAAAHHPEAPAATAITGANERIVSDIHTSAAAAVAASMLDGRQQQQQAQLAESGSAASSTSTTPRSSRLGSPGRSPGRMKRNVSFSMGDVATAAAAAAPAQLQFVVEEQQQQHSVSTLTPGSVWQRSSTPPARGVLKHDNQQQQQLALPLHQQVWHDNELFAGSGSPVGDTQTAHGVHSTAQQQQQLLLDEEQQQQQQQQQQQPLQDEIDIALQPWEGQLHHQHQLEPQQQQQQVEQQWHVEQAQQHAVPPRLPVLQQALNKLQIVQGSLEQLQSQRTSLTLGVSSSSSQPSSAAAANVMTMPDAQQEPEQDRQGHNASAGVYNWLGEAAASEAAAAAEAAAVAAEAAAAAAAVHAVASEAPNAASVAAAADGATATINSSATAATADGGDRSAAVAVTADWMQLSNQLSMAGFGPLSLVEAQEAAAAAAAGNTAGGMLAPQLTSLHDTLSQVLREYQKRDGLMAQLLQDRDALRREASRTAADAAKAERQRDEAVRALERNKAELADVRSREIPALDSKHRDAQAKLNSEVAKLKHALKEAEAATAAAKQAAAAAGHEQVQQQLQETIKEREQFSLECERLASEVARQKPYIRDLERAAAAARATARQSDEAAAQLQRQLGQMRQQQQQEVDALAAELNKARHTVREAEQQLSTLKAEAASRSDTTQELMKQLALERTQHEEQSAHLSSELQKLRQQLLALQQAAAKAEATAKADSSAAVHSSKQLAIQERSHSTEITKLTSELKQAREANQLLQAKLQEGDAAVVQQATAAAKAASEAKAEATRAAKLAQELERVQSGSKQQLQSLSQQLSECKRSLADAQQQLSSSQGELRRLRAAAGLVDGTTGAAAAAAGAGALTAAAAAAGSGVGALSAEAGSSSSVGGGFSVKPAAAAKVVLQQIGDGNTPALAAQQEQQHKQGLMEITLAPGVAAAAAGGGGPQSCDTDKENSSGIISSNPAATGSAGDKETTAGPAAATAAALRDADLAAALGRAVRAEAAAAEAEGALIALRYKLLTLEAAGSRMEREIESLRDRLGDKVIKEERRLARDKSAYARIRQAYASSIKRPCPAGMLGGLDPSSGGAAAARRAAAGAVAAAARELRPVELVGIYEGQKEALERELAAAKAEVRVLSGQLRDAQNLLISKDRAAAAAAAAAGLKCGAAVAAGLGDPAAAVAAQRKAAELTRELCTVRAEAAAALREAAKRLAETETQLNQLTTDNDDLQQELASRPTQQEHRQLKREIDLLQRKIASLKRQAAAARAGGAAAAGEEAVALTAAAVAGGEYADGEAWPPGEGGSGLRVLGGRKSVAAAVARDRAIARLGLGVVEEYPRDVLVDLIQDVCVVLELRDATLLVPNLRKMAAVLGAIPKLEAFVAQVCEACFTQGVRFVPAAVQHSMNPGSVVPVLQHWLALLTQGEQLRQLAQQLQQLLAQRSSTGGAEAATGAVAAVHTPVAAAGEAMQVQQLKQVSQQLLGQVEQLLQVEAEAIAAEDLLSAAKGLLATQPDGLLQSLLSHVLQLFDIPDLAALPAAMNKVYVHYSELINFFRAVSSLLCLRADAGPQAAMAAISSLLQQSAKPPSKVRQAAAELQRASGIAPPAPAADSAAAAGSSSSDAERSLQALLAALGVSSVQQAAQLHQGMKQRLERLDEVLPRYQRLATQLYERLRVVSLDDILPALDAVLAAA